MSSFIRPDNGFRGKQVRQGIQPKDHMKENMRDLKLSQIANREKREEDARPSKDLYKLSQFKDVDSRLYSYENNSSKYDRRPSIESKEFLTKGNADNRRSRIAEESRIRRIELEKKMEQAKMYSDVQPESSRKANIPNENARLAPASNTDFVSRNKLAAFSSQPIDRRSEMGESTIQHQPAVHEEFGRVPEYLEERKAQWAVEEDERRRNRPDPNCPPGMMLMPNEERLNTLEVLKENKAEALRQLRAMPFVVETPSMRRKQEMLEGKLREIDNALTIFSKDKVYIAK